LSLVTVEHKDVAKGDVYGAGFRPLRCIPNEPRDFLRIDPAGHCEPLPTRTTRDVGETRQDARIFQAGWAFEIADILSFLKIPYDNP
jgi:hypothetical protein